MSSDSRDKDVKRSKSAWSPQAIIIGFLIVIAVGTVFIVYPIVRHGILEERQAMARSHCIHNLHMIGVAVQSYYVRYQSYPPAYVADEDGKPAHSWRVLILPFLGLELKQLYDQYRFDEPWNGPNNSKLAETDISPYSCPFDRTPGTQTDYVAVVGQQTAWPGAASITPFRISDSIHDSIMLLEIGDSGIHWMEPRDLSFEQVQKGFAQSPGEPGIAINHGISVASCDGSGHYLADDTPADVLAALLTINGNEPVKISSAPSAGN